MSEMISRRSFLKVAGLSTAGIAVFGLTGCGGGGGGSSAVSTVYHVVDMNKFLQMSSEEKQAEMETWPQTNKVLFPCAGAEGNVNGAYDVVEMTFSVINLSSDKTVKFEHSEDDYDNFMDAMEEGEKTLEDAIEFAKKYESTDFQVNDAVVALSYGSKVKSATGVDTSVKELAAGESGVMTLVAVMKKGWSTLTFKYKPNFGDGEAFTFEIKPEDVERNYSNPMN